MTAALFLALFSLGSPARAQVPDIGPSGPIAAPRPRGPRATSPDGFEDPAERARVQERLAELEQQSVERQAKAPRAKLAARAEDGIDVGQQGAAVTRPGQGRERYLQSHGAGPCVIVSLYDPETKTAALSHMDAGTGVAQSLDLMVKSMGLPEGTPLQARLIGGMQGMSDWLLLKLVSELDKRGVAVLEADVKMRGEKAPPTRLRSPGLDGPGRVIELPGVPVDNVIFDAETGLAYDMEGLPPEGLRGPPPDLTRPSGHSVIMMERGLLAR